MGKRWWLAIGAIALIGVVAVWGGQRVRQGSEAEADETETAVVERTSLRVTVGGSGSLVPADEASASFSSGGEVVEVLAFEGDEVGTGQVLARLDTRALDLDVAAAEAAVTSATSALAAAKSQAEDVLDGASESELAEAQLNVDQAKDRLWGTQAQRDGVCGRVERKQGQQYECDSANASVLQGEGAVRVAELQLAVLLEGADAAEVAAARDKVTQAETSLASARNKLESARLKLEEATLTSPITGTVTAVNVAVGEPAASGTAAMVISRLDALQVDINLDEADVSGVEVGQEVVVTVDAFPDVELGGTVSRVAPVATIDSGVVLFPVTVDVAASELELRPGMTADVEIVLQSVADALVVPLRAIVSAPGGSFVMRVAAADGITTSDALTVPLGAAPLGGSGTRPDGQRDVGPFGGTPPPGGPMALADGTRPAAGAWRQAAVVGTDGSMSGDAVPVQVEVGIVSDTEAQILSGLSEGDVVLVIARSSDSDSGPMGRMPGGDMFIMGRP